MRWSCKNLTLRCINEGKKHYKQTCNIDPLAAFLLLRNHLSYRLMFPKQHAIKHWNVCVIFCPQVGLTLCQVRLSPTLWQLMLVSWPETSRSSVRIIQLWCKTRLEPGCSSAPTPGRESTIKVKKRHRPEDVDAVVEKGLKQQSVMECSSDTDRGREGKCFSINRLNGYQSWGWLSDFLSS